MNIETLKILCCVAAVLLFALGYVVGRWSGKLHQWNETRTSYRSGWTSRPMTPEEEREFDEGFKKMDEAFGHFGRIFGRPRR